MDDKDYLKDISEIKNMMAQSSRFISLSGLSGVLAGVYSLIGAWFAYRTIYFENKIIGEYKNLMISQESIFKLLYIAVSIIFLSISTAIFLSYRKSLKQNEKIWNSSSKRLIINFLIPLVTGGVFILFLIEKEMLGLVAPLTLIFYGLACVNASKYTLGDVRYLGITMIILGLLSTWFIGFGLLFWTIGFDFCHILYGSIMYLKHDRI